MLHLLILAFTVIVASGQDCVWNKDDFPAEYPPLLINLEDWQAYLPISEDSERVVRIADGATVVVACPGSTIAIGGDVAEGDCSGGVFLIDSTEYSIEDLGCSSRVDDNAIYSETGETCGDGDKGLVASIGFEVTGYQFYETIHVCFDYDMKNTLYAKHIVYGASVDASDGNEDRPSFQMGNGFFDYDPNECYLTQPQEDYYNELLNDDTFIDTSTSTYFSRGHLAPNAAFFTEMEADATFYYINVVPQWQDYNAQNWAYVESSVRHLAADHGTNLQIWTGPTDILQVEDSSGVLQDLYHCGSQGDNLIPVPEFVWKVVYEEPSNSAVAIVTSNRPHETVNPSPICPDIGCDTVTWLDVYYPSDLERGYTYCCTVDDLRSVVPSAPDLGNVDLLLS